MKLPRDVSGHDLLKALTRLVYQLVRQKGSHATVTTEIRGQHHVTVPMHDPIKAVTLNGILKDVAEHHDLTRDELLDRLFFLIGMAKYDIPKNLGKVRVAIGLGGRFTVWNGKFRRACFNTPRA